MTTKDRLFLLSQSLTPHHLVSYLAGKLADSECAWIKSTFIERFCKHYPINLSEAERENPSDYLSFNDFFTRSLKKDARPIAEADLVSPVDGYLAAAGHIESNTLIQAKGHHYSLEQLFAGRVKLASAFKDGQFATLYLAPWNYHRMHMPCDATLTDLFYVPGKLFSVNRLTTQQISGVFARNERVVAVFDSEKGRFAMVLVGAMIVGGIETVWTGRVRPSGQRPVIFEGNRYNQQLTLKAGDEMGRFHLGSTVILVTEKSWNLDWDSARDALHGALDTNDTASDIDAVPIQMGQRLF